LRPGKGLEGADAAWRDGIGAALGAEPVILLAPGLADQTIRDAWGFGLGVPLLRAASDDDPLD